MSGPEAKAVIFDLGGVLGDWQPRYVFEQMIPDIARRDFFLRHVCGSDWLEDINRGCPFDAAISRRQGEYPEWRDEIAAYFSRWGEMISGSIPGMESLLNELQRLGSRTFLFTNHPAETFETTVRKLPFLRSLEGAFISGFEGVTKPHPAAYRALLAKFGLAASGVVLVDDERENVLAAADLGWEAVLFANAEQVRKFLVKRNFLG